LSPTGRYLGYVGERIGGDKRREGDRGRMAWSRRDEVEGTVSISPKGEKSKKKGGERKKKRSLLFTIGAREKITRQLGRDKKPKKAGEEVRGANASGFLVGSGAKKTKRNHAET